MVNYKIFNLLNGNALILNFPLKLSHKSFKLILELAKYESTVLLNYNEKINKTKDLLFFKHLYLLFSGYMLT